MNISSHRQHFLFVGLVLLLQTRMNVGVAHSEVNPNTRVMNSRGIWLTYALGVGMLHVVLLSIPFFSVPVVWTLTNVLHNFVSPLFFLFLLLSLLLSHQIHTKSLLLHLLRSCLAITTPINT